MTKHSRLLGRDNRGSFPRPDSALLQPQFRGRGRVSAGAARPGSLPRGREARGQRKSGRLRGPGGRASGGTRVGTSQSGRWPDLAPAHLVCVVSQPANEVLDPAAVFVLAGRAAAPTAAAGSRAPGRGRAQPPAYPDGAGPARQRRSGRRRRVQPVLAECRRRQQLEEEEKTAEALGPAREAVRCSCLYIFEINSLSVASFAIIFSHSEGCLFTLLIVSFLCRSFLILIRSHLFIFAFISITLGGES